MKRSADNLSPNEEVKVEEAEASTSSSTFRQQAQMAANDLVAKVQGGRALLNERHQEKIGPSNEESSMPPGGFMSPSGGGGGSTPTADTATVKSVQVPVASITTASSRQDSGKTGSTTTRVRQAPLETTWRPASINSVLVNRCQEGNRVLRYIKNVSWEWSDDILPDYVVGVTQCVLFLSLRYHRLRPEYIYDRIQKLGNRYMLRVLMIQVDVTDHQELIRELTQLAINSNMTLFLGWSAEEVGRYIETFKAYEHRPPDAIRERVDDIYLARLTKFLTGIKSITRTDVLTLISNFHSVKRIIEATPEELSALPGFGEQKVRRLREAFSQPFITHG